MKWTRGQKGDKQKDGDDEKRIHNQAENCCHRYFMLFHSEINKFIAEDCLKRLMLTLLSGDVGLVPVLGGVLDKLDQTRGLPEAGVDLLGLLLVLESYAHEIAE